MKSEMKIKRGRCQRHLQNRALSTIRKLSILLYAIFHIIHSYLEFKKCITTMWFPAKYQYQSRSKSGTPVSISIATELLTQTVIISWWPYLSFLESTAFSRSIARRRWRIGNGAADRCLREDNRHRARGFPIKLMEDFGTRSSKKHQTSKTKLNGRSRIGYEDCSTPNFFTNLRVKSSSAIT
jgi:hypothetical protein